jgi:hypothetical protein
MLISIITLFEIGFFGNYLISGSSRQKIKLLMDLLSHFRREGYLNFSTISIWSQVEIGGGC